MKRALVIMGISAAAAVAVFGTRGPGPAGPYAARAAATSATVGGAPRLLELYTPWCPSCASMRPIVEELAARCKGTGVRIDAIDVSQEANEPVAERYGVRAVPTFLFLDASGEEAGRLVGAQSEAQLRRGLSALGGGACVGPVSTDGHEPPERKES